jgi:DNA-binding transcriptional MerR regulator
VPKLKEHSEKLYFSIGEVAEMLNVNASLIRYWEKEFTNVKPRKNRKGNRLFTAKDIESLRYIYHLVKEKGMTLEGAKKIINEPASVESSKFLAVETLEKLKNFLLQLKSEL